MGNIQNIAHADIGVILFDADGVIQRSTRDFIPTLQEIATASKKESNLFTKLYRAIGGKPSTAQHFMKDIFTAEQPCLVSSKDFPNEIQKVLDNWQIDIPLNEVMHLWGKITTYDEIITVIKALRKKGYTCGLATNQQSYRANIMRKDLSYDSLFDHHFYSCEMGIKKPDTKYFEHIVSKLEIPASQLLFIDDKEANVESAKQVGLNAFSFNATHSQDRVATLTAKLQQYGISYEM